MFSEWSGIFSIIISVTVILLQLLTPYHTMELCPWSRNLSLRRKKLCRGAPGFSYCCWFLSDHVKMVPNTEDILCRRIWCDTFVILDIKGNILAIKLDIQMLGGFKGLQNICNAFKFYSFIPTIYPIPFSTNLHFQSWESSKTHQKQKSKSSIRATYFMNRIG